MDDSSPVYSSRIIKTYLEYLGAEHPGLDTEMILQAAGMTKFEVEDPGHWFDQTQVDRFQEKITELTGKPDIARDAGRFAASARGLGYAKQLVLGLTSLSSGYMLISRIYPLLSRGAEVKATKLGGSQVEIISRPVAGIHEKPYQCKNRIGFFESLGKVFIGRYPAVEHPDCFHKGADSCRYVIRWENSPSVRWRAIRNYGFLLSLGVSLAALAALPVGAWLVLSLLLTAFVGGVSSYAQRLRIRELLHLIESQTDAAKEHIEGISERYGNTLLVQEIGQATSRILDTERLVNIIAENMERHLGHDRGLIFLKQGNTDLFRCVAHYGFDGEALKPDLDFMLSVPSSLSSGVGMWTCSEGGSSSGEGTSPEASLADPWEDLGRRTGVNALLGVPILFEEEVLGLLAVGDMDPNCMPTQSDLSLLRGVASQAANSLRNASSFQKLQESEEKYRDILESIEEGYFEVDLSGNLKFFNDSLCKITGYSRGELLGMNYRSYSTPESMKKLREVFSRVYRTGEPSESRDYEIVWKDGSIRFLELSTSLARGPSSRPEGFRGIVRDVTERIQTERERVMLEMQLRQSQKLEAIGTLAGGIAHDFNNILAAIMGFSELAILSSPDGSAIKKNMQEVLKASQRAKQLVHQILAFSRRTDSEREPIRLGPVIEEALKLLRASLPTTIEIRQHLPASDRSVEADPTQIHQVLMNLCTNAHHAMQDAGGILEVGLKPMDLTGRDSGAFPDLKPGPYVSLEVSDTGSGMEPEILERIFEPFFTTKGLGKGTGMGLAVVHGIVRSHGGAIRVRSTPGRGTTFQVLLPRFEGEAKGHAEITAAFPSGLERVLVVDDEASLNRLTKEMLERLGYEVESRTSPLDALEVFQAHPKDFHLIITDKTMPQLTGFRLAEEVRRIRSDIPIILCTGFGDPRDLAKAEAMGISRTLMKPLSLESLATAVREVLDEESARQARRH